MADEPRRRAWKVFPTPDEARRRAEEVRRRAEEVRRRAEEVRRLTGEARHLAEEVRRLASAAWRRAEEAWRRAEEAGRRAEEAGRRAEEAGRRADEALRLAEEARRLASAARRLTKEVRRLASAVRRLAEEARRLASAARRLTKEVRRLASAVRRLAEEARRLASAARRLAEEMRWLASAVRRLPEDLRRLAKEQLSLPVAALPLAGEARVKAGEASSAHKVAGRQSLMVALPPMANVARKAKKGTLSGPRHKLVRVRTAWHPVLVVLLEHVLPGGFYQCLSEFQLSREPLRIDVVVVRRSRPGTPPPPRLLASVVGDLADHTLVHFKGPTDELERDDARMLLAYPLQYLVVAEIEDPAPVVLRVVAPRLTPRFVQALKALGCALTTTEAGTHEGWLGVFPLRVIETVPVNARTGEHLLYTVTPGMLADPGGIPALSAEESDVFWALREHVEQLRHPLPGQRKRHMKDEDKVVESFEQAMVRHLSRLPLKERQRLLLPTLSPEQRLAGLTDAQAVLALPDTMLRGLSTEYLATLPRETRAAIQRRLGGTAASPRPPARRRKPRGRSG